MFTTKLNLALLAVAVLYITAASSGPHSRVLRCSSTSPWSWRARFGDSGRRILAHSQVSWAPLETTMGDR